MDPTTLLNDPHAQLAALALAASAFSTVHTYLDKHPRVQAVLRLAAHCVGPLNLPAMKAAGVALCRAVVAYEDKTPAAPKQPAAPSDGTKAWPQS